MAKIIGLTGGIGSGKTTIAKYFQAKGVPVYIADDEAKKIMKNKEVIGKIIDAFGVEILENKVINRSKLSSIVFNNPAKLKTLNSIIHPEVKAHFLEWVNQHQHFSFVIKEAAILFESGSYKDCDQIIVVTAPKETRIERVIKRDKISREEVEARMVNQWSDELKITLSDYLIQNISITEAQIAADKIISALRNQ